MSELTCSSQQRFFFVASSKLDHAFKMCLLHRDVFADTQEISLFVLDERCLVNSLKLRRWWEAPSR
jgi:hypothetical protein